MTILSASELAKSYGGRDLFHGVSFDLSEGQRLAVVGPNGTGKSTLLKLIVGRVESDRGKVNLAKGARVGFAEQELASKDLDTPLLNWVLKALPSWSGFWADWNAAVTAGDNKALERLGAKQAELEAAYGYNPEHQAGTILSGLGFGTDRFTKPLHDLSGGWRERAKLSRALLAGSDLLILDEPTNHLDLEAVRWLESFLACRRGALLFVVHDRFFLDNVATHLLALGGNKPIVYAGGWADYLEWTELREETKKREAAKLAAEIGRHEDYARRFRAKARRASQAQSKLKQADRLREKLDDITFEQRRKTLSFKLPDAPRGDKVALHAADLTFAFPGKDPLWNKLTFHLYRGQKVALAGPNGAGKSTLLKLAVGELKPVSGTIAPGPATPVGYFSQHQAEILRPDYTVLGELRRLADPRTTEEQLMGTLGLFLLGQDYFERPVASLSGGEKSRLALSALFLKGAGLLVMDEPTNHLDMETRLSLVEALQAFNGTLFLVAHDRWLLSEAVDEIWHVGPSGLRVFQSGYTEYEAWLMSQERGEPTSPKQACEAGALEQPKVVRNDKEERRRKAEIRQRFQKDLAPKKKAYEKLEAELSALLERQTVLETKLADPATYAKQDEFVALTTEYKKSQDDSERMFLEMAELEEEIGKLEAEREAELGEEYA